MNQNSSFSFSFLCNLQKPNLSNWMTVPTFSFSSAYSPSPVFVVPSGILISTLMLFGEAGSQWRNLDRFAARPAGACETASLLDRLVPVRFVGSSEMKEKSRGLIPILSDLKVKRCISR